MNKVYYSPCMPVMATYPDNFFDLTVADIPYGLDVTNMGYTRRQTKTVKRTGRASLKINTPGYKSGAWDLVTPDQQYFDELCRISRHQIIFGIDYVEWEGVGPGRIKWDKCVPDGVSFSRYEMAYCSLIDYELTIPLLWSGMMQAISLSKPTKQNPDKKRNEKRIHPCQKPVLLYDAIFQKFGFPGMKVFDSHLGSGSIRISAEKLNYHFEGCENNIDTFTAQEERFQKHLLQPRFQGW